LVRITISTSNEQEIFLTIVPTSTHDPIKVIGEAEALEHGEALYQITEGRSYEYLIDEGYYLEDIPGLVVALKLNKHAGRITPNIYVGTLLINIIDNKSYEKVAVVRLEVQSEKASYREDYRRMLEEIAEKCTDLLMQHSSPVVQSFTIDLEKDSSTAYQRFAFIKSIIDSDDFDSAIHKIITSPTTKWRTTLANKSVSSVKRIDRKTIRQFACSTQRIDLPFGHPLQVVLSSLPEKIQIISKEETVDTPENRFVKFALDTFLKLCSDFSHLNTAARLKKEASVLEDKLEQYLDSSLFQEVSALSSLPTNNPVLQRKEGYREIYGYWILFDLAAKLTWQGGEDVYYANKRDVAVLYEYWLFFKLIELVTDVFNLNSPNSEDLLDRTSDGFGLKLRQGEYLPLKGISDIGSRKLYVQLSYNRTYKGDQPYPNPGSWSRNLRPDYTITIWPYGITESQAEVEELIVHIHFDAKYKIEKFQEIFSGDVQLDEEKEEQRKGTYKRADLLKMHAYKDAIRRTAGAYVLYPGQDQPKTKTGFHEIIPGLGAFAIRPSLTDNGVQELRLFLSDVTKNLMNRASQREKMSFRTYDIYKNKNSNELFENFPETIGHNRSLIPDDTFVLIGYYRKENWAWIVKSGLYNARAGSSRGSLRLGPGEAGAKYLLLHSDGELITNKILKITETGPRIFSQKTLIKLGYSPSRPPRDYYLVYKVEDLTDEELLNYHWDIRKLAAYNMGRRSGFPFAVTFTELMKASVK